MLFNPEKHQNHHVYSKHGWSPRLSVGSTHANYTHPKLDGTVTQHSNGSWEHHAYGKLLREGQSHIDLRKYLSSLKASQHSELTDSLMTIERAQAIVDSNPYLKKA